MLCIAVSASLAVVIFVLPSPAPTLAPLAVENLPQTGLGNPVAAVLFAYRALDTLLEKVVLLLALLSVWSLAADRVWPGMPGLHAPAFAGSTLGFLARHLPPFGIIIGVYMCWIGATQPGGAFQGGTVVAAMWLLIMIAGMRAVPSIDGTRLRLALVTGPAIFVVIGLAGIAAAGSFLAYPPDYAKLLIVVIEVALTLSIAAVLGLLAAGPPVPDARS